VVCRVAARLSALPEPVDLRVRRLDPDAFRPTDFFNPLTGAALGISAPQTDFNGWFIGGGHEYRLPWFQGLTWKTEYRFSQYRGVDEVPFVTATGVTGNSVLHDEKFVQTVTSSLVWRFNFGGASY
jgi:outer membrane immunogenic protein